MNRYRDWEDRLAAFGSAQFGDSYRWGETDCVSLALRGLAAMFDDVPTPWWDNEDTGRRAAQGDAVGQWVDDHGGTAISSTHARSGDVLIGESRGLPSVYLVIGRRALSSDPERGVFTVALSELMLSDRYTCRRFG